MDEFFCLQNYHNEVKLVHMLKGKTYKCSESKRKVIITEEIEAFPRIIQ